MVHILTWSRDFSHAMELLAELIEIAFGKGEKEIDVFECLVFCAEDCNWDPVVFDMLIKAYAKVGLFGEAYRVFRRMVRLGFVPNVVAFNFLLNGLSKLNCMDKCWKLYDDMWAIGIVPNTITFNILTHVICKDQYVEKVNEFLEKMEEQALNLIVELKRYGVPIPSNVYSYLIVSLCQYSHPFAAVKLLDRAAEDGYEPNEDIYENLIKSLCKNECIIDPLRYKCEMLEKNIKPSLAVYQALIICLCNLKRTPEAESLMEEMVEGNLKPDCTICRALVTGYCKADNVGYAEDVLFLFAMEYHLYDSVSYNALMKKLSEEGDLSKPLDVQNKLMKLGYAPSSLTCKYMLDGLWNVMGKDNCTVDAVKIKSLSLKVSAVDGAALEMHASFISALRANPVPNNNCCIFIFELGLEEPCLLNAVVIVYVHVVKLIILPPGEIAIRGKATGRIRSSSFVPNPVTSAPDLLKNNHSLLLATTSIQLKHAEQEEESEIKVSIVTFPAHCKVSDMEIEGEALPKPPIKLLFGMRRLLVPGLMLNPLSGSTDAIAWQRNLKVDKINNHSEHKDPYLGMLARNFFVLATSNSTKAANSDGMKLLLIDQILVRLRRIRAWHSSSFLSDRSFSLTMRVDAESSCSERPSISAEIFSEQGSEKGEIVHRGTKVDAWIQTRPKRVLGANALLPCSHSRLFFCTLQGTLALDQVRSSHAQTDLLQLHPISSVTKVLSCHQPTQVF
ncbi:hypothetical protein V2J09_013202 [Rumex salicifolius]